MSLLVLQSHDGVQLQDAGRFGGAALGLTQGGALDSTAARLATALAGNPVQAIGNFAALLEITFGGVAFRAEAPLQIACAGAACPLRINGVLVSRYQRLWLAPGDLLQIGYSRGGARLYLAVAGGFGAPLLLGSCATVRREGVGGFDGRGSAVKTGDVLACQPFGGEFRPLSLPYTGHYRHRPLRQLVLVPGAQLSQLPPAIETLLPNRLWQLSPHSDRMGVRLKGPALAAADQALLSEGICTGAVQLPPDGQPLVMLNDHQTIGGYPKLGAITPQSCEWLGQAQPGDLVQFVWQSAVQAVHSERQRLLALQRQLDLLCGAGQQSSN